MKITIIGSGNMGGALAKGFVSTNRTNSFQDEVLGDGSSLNTSDYEKPEVTITARTAQTLEKFSAYDLSAITDNIAAVVNAEVVILAVKPWLIETICKEICKSLPKHVIICSVAAGISSSQIEQFLSPANTENIFCVMPDIAAEFNESMTFIAPHPNASASALSTVEKLFRRVGEVKVCEERLLPAGTMMAGCGIAYVMRFLRAQTEAGVEMGFYPTDALKIAIQTMEGAVAVLKHTGEHPEAAIDRVTTPGGITIKGLNELDHSGFNSAVIRCFKAGIK